MTPMSTRLLLVALALALLANTMGNATATEQDDSCPASAPEGCKQAQDQVAPASGPKAGSAPGALAPGVVLLQRRMPSVEKKEAPRLSLALSRSDDDAARQAPVQGGGLSWSSSGQWAGEGQWCKAEVPSSSWNLRTTCGGPYTTRVKVLTYNLFWWNLFGARGGNGGSAGKLMAQGAGGEGYDIMAFQECDDIYRVLNDAGMGSTHTAVNAGHAVGLAYLTSRWSLQGKGGGDVAEDTKAQWYGRRIAYWLRLRNTQSGKTVFFVNHHGPLPVNSGGVCGGDATAFNMLKMVAGNAQAGDLVIIVGDFNADSGSAAIQRLGERMWSTFAGTKFGGVDHIFSNCGPESVVSTRNLGGAGSDHDALDATFQF